MSRYTVDLHNHTPAAPSAYHGASGTTVRQIVERALDRGVHVFGSADHFTIHGGVQMVGAADEVERATGRRLLVLPGAMIPVLCDGETAHLVALFPPSLAEVRFHSLLGALGLSDPVAPPQRLEHVTIERDGCHVARMIRRLGGLCHIVDADRDCGGYQFADTEVAGRLVRCDAVSAVGFADLRNAFRLGSEARIACITSSASRSLGEVGRRTTALEMADLSFGSLAQALDAFRG